MINEHHLDVRTRVIALRRKVTNIIVTYLFFIGIIAVPVSISRAFFTGWLLVYTMNVIALCVISITFFLRYKLSTKLKSWVVFWIVFTLSSVGLFNYGIFGGAMLWVVYCLILCIILFDLRTSVIVASILLACFVLSMYRFVFMGAEIPGGASVYISSLSSWGAILAGSVSMIVLIGAIFVYRQRQVIELLGQLEQQNELISKQKGQIEHQANHDVLTGLPTLRLADDRLEVTISLAKREGHKAAVMFLDLDGFKSINDRYGHDAGDHILKETAKRILSVIRESDTACRIGGDEFIIILNKIANTEDAASFCTRLIDIIGVPVNFADNELMVGVSIGVAIYPNNATDAAGLRKRADEVMYEVKRSGKNNYLIAV